MDHMMFKAPLKVILKPIKPKPAPVVPKQILDKLLKK